MHPDEWFDPHLDAFVEKECNENERKVKVYIPFLICFVNLQICYENLESTDARHFLSEVSNSCQRNLFYAISSPS